MSWWNRYGACIPWSLVALGAMVLVVALTSLVASAATGVYTLYVNNQAMTQGSITIEGHTLTVDPAPESNGKFKHGDTIYLTADTSDVTWQGDCAGTVGATCGLVMGSDRHATIQFNAAAPTPTPTPTPTLWYILINDSGSTSSYGSYASSNEAEQDRQDFLAVAGNNFAGSISLSLQVPDNYKPVQSPAKLDELAQWYAAGKPTPTPTSTLTPLGVYTLTLNGQWFDTSQKVFNNHVVSVDPAPESNGKFKHGVTIHITADTSDVTWQGDCAGTVGKTCGLVMGSDRNAAIEFNASAAGPTATIDALYTCIGREQSWLGSATSGPYPEASTGKPRQDFQEGSIAWIATWNHYYALSNRSIYDLWLAPKVPLCVQQWAIGTDQRSIANTYNRIGGKLKELSDQNTMEVEVALAVWKVEAVGKAFGSDGRLIIRFENHKLWDTWVEDPFKKPELTPEEKKERDRRIAEFNKHFRFGTSEGRDKGHYIRGSSSCPGPSDWTHIHLESYGAVYSLEFQKWQYEALRIAQCLAGEKYAYYSISMGGPQIMGFNCCGEILPNGSRYWDIGYDTPKQMYNAFSAAEFNQIVGFFEYMKDTTAITYARQKNWVEVAAWYNGEKREYYGEPGVDTYKEKLPIAYEQAKEVLEKK